MIFLCSDGNTTLSGCFNVFFKRVFFLNTGFCYGRIFFRSVLCVSTASECQRVGVGSKERVAGSFHGDLPDRNGLEWISLIGKWLKEDGDD